MSEILGWTPGITLEEWEKIAIQKAFHFFRGNKSQTASALGIAIRTLDSKLEKYELDRKLAQEAYEKEKRDNARILERLRGVSPADTVEAGRSSLYRADTGVHLESPTFTGQEPDVSLPKREEVQTLLPPELTISGPRRGRQAVQIANGKGKNPVSDEG